MKATAALAILFVALAAGCGGGSKSSPAPTAPAATEPTPAGTDTAPAPAKQPTGRGSGAEAARAKSTFAMYPKGVKLVAGVSAAQLRKSVLWPHIAKLIDARAASEVAMFKDACGMDATQVVDEAEIALDPKSSEHGMVVVLEGSFTRADAARCADALGARQNDPVTVTDDGPTSSYKAAHDTLWAGWPNDHMVVLGDGSHDKAWVEARLAGQSSIREDDTLMEVVGNVDTTSTAWFAFADEDGQLASALGPQLGGRPPSAVYAWLRITDAAKGEIGLGFASEGDAKVAANALEAMVGQLKADQQVGPIVSNARVGAYGKSAVIELDLDKQQLELLVQLLTALPI